MSTDALSSAHAHAANGLEGPNPAVASPGATTDHLADKLAGSSLEDSSPLVERRHGSQDSTDDECESQLRRYSNDMEDYHRHLLVGIEQELSKNKSKGDLKK